MSYLSGGTGPGKAFSVLGFGAMFMPLDGYGVSAVLGSGVAVEELLETSSGRNLMSALVNVLGTHLCNLCFDTRWLVHMSCGIVLTIPTGGWTVTSGWSNGRCTLVFMVRSSFLNAVSVCWW